MLACWFRYVQAADADSQGQTPKAPAVGQQTAGPANVSTQQHHALPQLQLPAAFLHLQQQYASLQMDSTQTSGAAAGFMQQLGAAYDATTPQHSQLAPASAAGAGMQELRVHAFVAQAHFVGLVAAVLRAVQVRPGRPSPMPCVVFKRSWCIATAHVTPISYYLQYCARQACHRVIQAHLSRHRQRPNKQSLLPALLLTHCSPTLLCRCSQPLAAAATVQAGADSQAVPSQHGFSRWCRSSSCSASIGYRPMRHSSTTKK